METSNSLTPEKQKVVWIEKETKQNYKDQLIYLYLFVLEEKHHCRPIPVLTLAEVVSIQHISQTAVVMFKTEYPA